MLNILSPNSVLVSILVNFLLPHRMSLEGDIWIYFISSVELGHYPHPLKVVWIHTDFMAKEKEHQFDLLMILGLRVRNPSTTHSMQQTIWPEAQCISVNFYCLLYKLLTVEKLDQNIKDYQRSRVCALHNHWWSTLTSPSLDALHMVICLPDYYFMWLICKFKQMCFQLALIHHWCQNIREKEA